MKKNTKMAANAKKRMEKEKELERLSNKELIIFSMGLVAEVILLYFYSALKSAVRKDAEVILMWMAGIFFAGFAALLVTSILSAKKPSFVIPTRRTVSTPSIKHTSVTEPGTPARTAAKRISTSLP